MHQEKGEAQQPNAETVEKRLGSVAIVKGSPDWEPLVWRGDESRKKKNIETALFNIQWQRMCPFPFDEMMEIASRHLRDLSGLEKEIDAVLKKKEEDRSRVEFELLEEVQGSSGLPLEEKGVEGRKQRSEEDALLGMEGLLRTPPKMKAWNQSEEIEQRLEQKNEWPMQDFDEKRTRLEQKGSNQKSAMAEFKEDLYQREELRKKDFSETIKSIQAIINLFDEDENQMTRQSRNQTKDRKTEALNPLNCRWTTP